MATYSAQPSPQQVFKPRESVAQFSRIFPFMYAALVVVFLAFLGVGIWLNMWVLPVMVAFPAFSVIAGGIYASRMRNARVVIDGERLRLFHGSRVQANLAWRQITRLTIRKTQEDSVYEIWVGETAVPLPADFFEDGDKLLKAVSARTQRPWEAVA